MTDSNYIPPSERERRLDGWCEACHNTGIGATGDPSDVCRYCPNELGTADILGHMTFMDERDARQRGLIRRLAEALEDDCGCERYGPPDDLLIEARGVRQPMSRPTCTNCGSATRVTALWHSWNDMPRRGSWQEPEKYECIQSPETCELIRSLREELAKAKATLKEHELVCYGAMQRGRDAERDRCADWLRTQICDYPFEHRGTIQAIIAHICDNEHRSNT